MEEEEAEAEGAEGTTAARTFLFWVAELFPVCVDHAVEMQMIDTTVVSSFKAMIDLNISFCCFVSLKYRAKVIAIFVSQRSVLVARGIKRSSFFRNI